ncbi:hypothetical protein [Streptomyces daliensis]|uniref:Lipoprotein n=1 Tax=Streptomyces daliensis TaxID=299421 RepID=A0A8T4IMG5_9ACTN|nr:hypothetical protein [Streptomyces daliensis]
MRARLAAVTVAAAYCAALTATVTGCAGTAPAPGTGEGGGPASPAPPPAPTQEVKELTLPLDAYTLGAPEMARITVAQDRLIGACMARAGLDWPRLPAREERVWPHRGRYGLIEPEPAARYGYHPLPDPHSEATEAWLARREAKLSPEQRTAAYGAAAEKDKAGNDGEGSSAGCEREAERALLRGVPKADFELVDEISADTYDRSRRAPAVTKAFARWSACMRDRGFDYADPTAANDDARWRRTAKKPSRAEIATARADVACKRATSLVGVWWRTEAAYQKRQLRAHADDLADVREARDRYLANVARHENT